ncbi:hypothetical protein [Sphingorhabdus sp. SMR4y]|uniref:hypothetical protein n=1 Tax=Sphingorhabdus sp. SMR4y TaxID=2584094 RepID=UPI0021B4B8F3|nr:hypothetical protein [Sphingorhabdus sp. SMR4y]
MVRNHPLEIKDFVFFVVVVSVFPLDSLRISLAISPCLVLGLTGFISQISAAHADIFSQRFCLGGIGFGRSTNGLNIEGFRVLILRGGETRRASGPEQKEKGNCVSHSAQQFRLRQTR